MYTIRSQKTKIINNYLIKKNYFSPLTSTNICK